MLGKLLHLLRKIKNKKGKWVTVIKKPATPPAGYSQTFYSSGLWKLHEQGFKGKDIRVCAIGSGLEPSRCLAGKEGQVKRESFVPGEAATIGQTVDYHENHLANLILCEDLKIGTAPEVSYLNLKVKNSAGNWTPDMLSAALEYIVGLPENQRPHIVFQSFGFDNPQTDDFKYAESKYDQLKGMGVVCFGSSGNASSPLPDWPSRHFGNSVGAIKFNGQLCIFSNQARYVFYGQDIKSVNRLGIETTIEGTSFSTPQLVGCIASYLSMKVAKGSNLKQILSSLETSLKLDGYIKDHPSGLLFQVP